MLIDTSFDVKSDAGGLDPDLHSPTLRRYHQKLWSKPLPCGVQFTLEQHGKYLRHSSTRGTFDVGSDAITHSYKNHLRKRWLTSQIPEEVADFFARNSTIASYTIFPNKQINRQHTINQARGIKGLIDDRFDLTLECIRRHYAGGQSPLSQVLARYGDFFALFESFDGYVDFFLLQDLVTSEGSIKFYLPFDGFATRPRFNSVTEYLEYKHKVLGFTAARSQRMEEWCNAIP